MNTKKIKEVFSNAQLAHVWVQQTQKTGRNPNKSMFFEDNTIYSYGYHYAIAKIHTVKKQKIFLINEHNYSPTTCKQRGDVMRAIPDKKLNFHHNCFYVPNVDKIKTKENVLYQKNRLIEETNRLLIVNTVNEWVYKESIPRLLSIKNEVNSFLKLCGLKNVDVDKKTFNKIKERLETRYAIYKQKNSPEALKAKKEAEDKKQAEKQAQAIKDFRDGKNVYINLPYELLRITESEVITSRGARVPIGEAYAFKNQLETLMADDVSMDTIRSLLIGKKIGSFTVNNVANEEILVIGCHNIEIKEVLSLDFGNYIPF